MTSDQLFSLAAVITAFGVITGQIFTFLQARRNAVQIGDVHAAVTTSNGKTIGMIADGVEERAQAEITNGSSKP